MSDQAQLLERGRAALQAGNRLAARGYFRRAARNAPERLDIWQELCQVSDRVQDRIECLSRIVELDPSNVEAQEELARLQPEAEPEQAEPEMVPTELSVPPDAAQAAPEDLQPALTGIRLDVTDEMRQAWDRAVAAGQPLYCIDHPQRETVLRCNRCAAPVCPDCVVRTPVGFRCKKCVQAQQSGFYNAHWYDWIVAAIISFVLAIPASLISGLLGWWFSLIVSPIIGSLIGGAVHWATGRRRGRNTWWIVGASMVVGTLLVVAARATNALSALIFAILATGAAIGILRLGKTR